LHKLFFSNKIRIALSRLDVHLKMRIALNVAEEEAALSRMVGDITLDDGSSSDEDVAVHRERSRRARRLQQRHRPSHFRNQQSPSGSTPANVRTLGVWGCVGLMLPMLTGASSAMRCVLAFACILRYLANLRALFVILRRCIFRSTNIPIGTILAWELWAPRRFNRAVLAVLAISFAACVTTVVSQLFFDLCVEVMGSDSIHKLI